MMLRIWPARSLNWHVTASELSGLRTGTKGSPRLGRPNLSGLDPPPSGEWTWSLPAGVSLDEASESTPSRSALHWSSYIRSDGMVSCFLSTTTTNNMNNNNNVKLATFEKKTHTHTHLFSLLPFPVSRNPLAKGLLSIFSCVIWEQVFYFYLFIYLFYPSSSPTGRVLGFKHTRKPTAGCGFPLLISA